MLFGDGRRDVLAGEDGEDVGLQRSDEQLQGEDREGQQGGEAARDLVDDGFETNIR